MKEIPETIAKRPIVQVGSVVADFLEISVVPDLLDWNGLKLVNVSLSYVDEANGIDEKADLRFKNGDAEKKWKVALSDKAKTSYTWSAIYFMTDGSRKTVDPTTDSSLSLFLEVPA